MSSTNFAVAASQDTILRGAKVLEAYKRPGEKNEAALIRILDLAEAEQVWRTHPELSGHTWGRRGLTGWHGKL